jgi:hypothetical protein
MSLSKVVGAYLMFNETVCINKTIYDLCKSISNQVLQDFLKSEDYARRIALNLDDEVVTRVDAHNTSLYDYGVYYLEITYCTIFNEWRISNVNVYGSSKMISYEPDYILRDMFFNSNNNSKFINMYWYIIDLDNSVEINTDYLFQFNYFFALPGDVEHKIVLNDNFICGLDEHTYNIDDRNINSYKNSQLRLISASDREERFCIIFNANRGSKFHSPFHSLVIEDNMDRLRYILIACSCMKGQTLSITFSSSKSDIASDLLIFVQECVEYALKYSGSSYFSIYLQQSCDLLITCQASDPYICTDVSLIDDILIQCKERWDDMNIIELLEHSFKSVNYKYIDKQQYEESVKNRWLIDIW